MNISPTVAFAALAHATRLAVFKTLVRAGCDGASPSWLAQRLDVSTTALSFHLKELMRAGLVDKRRDGRQVRYRAEFARMRALIAFLTDECCAHPEAEPAPETEALKAMETTPP